MRTCVCPSWFKICLSMTFAVVFLRELKVHLFTAREIINFLRHYCKNIPTVTLIAPNLRTKKVLFVWEKVCSHILKFAAKKFCLRERRWTHILKFAAQKFFLREKRWTHITKFAAQKFCLIFVWEKVHGRLPSKQLLDHHWLPLAFFLATIARLRRTKGNNVRRISFTNWTSFF